MSEPVNNPAPGGESATPGNATSSKPQSLSIEEMIAEDIASFGGEEPDKKTPDAKESDEKDTKKNKDDSESEDEDDESDLEDEDEEENTDDSEDDDSDSEEEEEDSDDDDAGESDDEDGDDEEEDDTELSAKELKKLLGKDSKDLSNEDKAAIMKVGSKRFSKVIDQRNESRGEVKEMTPKLETAEKFVSDNTPVLNDIDRLFRLADIDPVLKNIFGSGEEDSEAHWYFAGRAPQLKDFDGDEKAFSAAVSWVANEQAQVNKAKEETDNDTKDSKKLSETQSKERVKALNAEMRELKDHVVWSKFLKTKELRTEVKAFMKKQWANGNTELKDVQAALFMMKQKEVVKALQKNGVDEVKTKTRKGKRKLSLKSKGKRVKGKTKELTDQQVAAMSIPELIALDIKENGGQAV